MDGAIRTGFALGMGKVRGALVLLLRIEALLALAEIADIAKRGRGRRPRGNVWLS